MGWQLIKEIGGQNLPAEVTEIDLHYPSLAQRMANGSYWINDEYGTEKLVPFRFESRTMGVDVTGKVLFDSKQLGIDDGFGCPVDSGSIAILRRTQWELLEVNLHGEVIHRIALFAMSKRMPRKFTWTKRGTYLVVFCNRVGETEIVEIDREGHLLWFLAPGAEHLGIASDIQAVGHENFVIADPVRHVVFEMNRDGRILWQFGVANNPANDKGRLSSPGSIREMSDGRRLVADTRNHRVLQIDLLGHAEELSLKEGGWCDPVFATELPSGNFLVCDTGNRRVVETDSSGNIVCQIGQSQQQHRTFSYPRSVESISENKLLIADTANNRVIEIADDQDIPRKVVASPELFWPRCARPLESAGMIIADGRNGRVVEIDAEGRVKHELSSTDSASKIKLEDPHDVRLLPNGHLLIADSAQDLVLEVDWSGKVYRKIGTGPELRLRDPHSVQSLNDQLIIADTGNHRIVILDSKDQCVRNIGYIQDRQFVLRLNFPRHVEMYQDGTLVIADTGNNRVLACDPTGQLLWEFSCVPDAAVGRLNQPRWAKWILPNELLVSDHFHHRILHVRLVR
ncbi:MAG: hypothetical protein KDB03_12835 [Planctomycetales bacterium]|nr:hypothetical protein [Planctomycetales bacterium]